MSVLQKIEEIETEMARTQKNVRLMVGNILLLTFGVSRNRQAFLELSQGSSIPCHNLRIGSFRHGCFHLDFC
jgi:hypothetical protein